jgi:PhoPQ-activated pathogenicity-related protein
MPPAALLAAALMLAAPARAEDALLDYLHNDDPSFAFELRQEGRIGAAAWAELRLVSQTWRGIPWRHQLFVVHPSTPAAPAAQGLLFLAGGIWLDALDRPGHRTDPPPDVALFATLAETLGTPIGLLGQVPFQPLFDGLTEDRLIAYSLARHLESGEDDWPLLLPMVKSAVRAMDAMTAFTRDRTGTLLSGFTVAGASKRGWTAWLTAASDPRVRAVVPMVIDLLDIEAHLALQQETFGDYSTLIGDYTRLGLHEQAATPAGQRLLDMIDPYRRRERLAMPKLIVLATNDAYWPLDASRLYLEGLPGPSWLLRLPNEGHSPRDWSRLIGGITSLHRLASSGSPMPALDWRFEQDGLLLRLRVRSDMRPDAVLAWRALAPSRDFRASTWTAAPCMADGEGWHLCELALPERGYGALFAELVFPGTLPSYPLHLSTQVEIAARAGGG